MPPSPSRVRPPPPWGHSCPLPLNCLNFVFPSFFFSFFHFWDVTQDGLPHRLPTHRNFFLFFVFRSFLYPLTAWILSSLHFFFFFFFKFLRCNSRWAPNVYRLVGIFFCFVLRSFIFLIFLFLFFFHFWDVTQDGLLHRLPTHRNFFLFFCFPFISLPLNCLIMHPRPSGRHIGIDGLPLILSFELKFFVCRHVSMWGFQNRVCLSVRLSVRTPRKEILLASSISVLH